MAGHASYDLPQMQSLPLEAKIIMTQRRVIDWYNHYNGNVYLSWSGGKDSTVLKHIIENTPVIRTMDIVYCDTGLEYPEVKKLVYDEAKENGNIQIIRPKMSFREVIDKYGYPVISKEQAQYIYEVRTTKSQKLIDKRLNGREGHFKISEKHKYLIDAPFLVSDKCCKVMKKAPFHEYEKETGYVPIIATMAEESMLRLHSWLKYGCNAFESPKPKSQPMAFWTEQDVLEYIRKYNVKIPSVYGEVIEEDGKLKLTGVKRTGCMYCMFGVHLEPEPNRFQLMYETHPAIYDYCINKLGIGGVLDYIGVNYKPQPEQLTLWGKT